MTFNCAVPGCPEPPFVVRDRHTFCAGHGEQGPAILYLEQGRGWS